VTVATTLRDRSGKLLRKVEKSDTLHVWQQVLLLLAMPWHYPDTVEAEMIYDLHRSTILECRQGSLFDEPVAAAPQYPVTQGGPAALE